MNENQYSASEENTKGDVNHTDTVDPGDSDLEILSPELLKAELAEFEPFDDTQLATDLINHANYCWRRGTARYNRDKNRHGMLVCMDGYLVGNIPDALGAFLHLENDNRGAQRKPKFD